MDHPRPFSAFASRRGPLSMSSSCRSIYAASPPQLDAADAVSGSTQRRRATSAKLRAMPLRHRLVDQSLPQRPLSPPKRHDESISFLPPSSLCAESNYTAALHRGRSHDVHPELSPLSLRYFFSGCVSESESLLTCGRPFLDASRHQRRFPTEPLAVLRTRLAPSPVFRGHFRPRSSTSGTSGRGPGLAGELCKMIDQCPPRPGLVAASREMVLVDVAHDMHLQRHITTARGLVAKHVARRRKEEEELSLTTTSRVLELCGVVAEYVHDALGGAAVRVDKDCVFPAERLVVNLGDVARGVCRHRALLVKVICDCLGYPCRLVRGSYRGRPHVWNVVVVTGADVQHKSVVAEYVLDAMRARAARIFPYSSDEAAQYVPTVLTNPPGHEQHQLVVAADVAGQRRRIVGRPHSAFDQTYNNPANIDDDDVLSWRP
eukprot:PhM_4_TR11222/c0_g1_i2/m.18361